MGSSSSYGTDIRSGFIVDIKSLRSQDAVDDAVAQFENARLSHLERLLFQPNLLEIVYSVANNPRSLSQKILELFPTSPNEYPGSNANKLLSRFGLFLHFLPSRCFSEETGDSLRLCRISVEKTPSVLLAISNLSLDTTTSSVVAENDVVVAENDQSEEEEFIIDSNSSSRSQRKRKDEIIIDFKPRSQRKQKQGNHSANIDTKPFEDLGIDVPSTSEEAQNLASRILEDQKDILKYYLSVLRRPETTEAINAIYLSSGEKQEPHMDSQESFDESTSTAATEPQPTNTPRAVPNVQPMKASLYFDSAEGFGEWRILISTRATRDLRDARGADARKFKTIIKKIKELSNGHFSDDNQKRLNGPSTDIPIFEAKMTRDLRLVYQVDCVPEYDSDIERQVIRVFGIYTHAQLDKRFWDSMSWYLCEKGKEYKRRCIFRNPPYHAGDNVITPATFPTPVDLPPCDATRSRLDLPDEHLAELHSLLALEKFVTLSQAFLNSIIAKEDVSHVFEVSIQEKEIIEHSYSCYVLGRSGTGKTTTMLFKMLGIERAWSKLGSDGVKPRQLFVTQSRILAEKVQEYFLKLLQSLATGSYSLRELAEMAKMKKDAQGEAMLIDHDDDVNWREDLPQRFSQLEDKHFPLFVNFERLCKLLEADIAASATLTQSTAAPDAEFLFNDEEPKNSPRTPFANCSFHRKQHEDRGMVSYETFFESYWPHFPQHVIKGLDPALVYSEIMGVIKGSEDALTCPGRFLDEDKYLNLSFRSQSTFATQRDTIYTVFDSYLRRKRERNEYDPADRTHTILEYLQRAGTGGRMVDYLYVDEAQDNLLIDALLLRSICRNPDGLFWAGDTAQTISIGSSFRFDDLKAFLYRISERNQSGSSRKKREPKSFQLAINYRSHGGIVNCAHSVIQLITQFWPDAIDSLRPEKGVVDGLRPVFLGGWDQDSVRYEQFLFGASGSHIEFGAQQCILVRSAAARERLREQVGDIGLIMTLYESKGLEFNDVLLYNFFQDSSVDLPRWRVVLNAIEGIRRSGPPPRLTEARHMGLKFLYVAITRARKNMWIVDSSEKSEPMREFWSSKDLVQYCSPGDVPHLAVSSTPDEWAQQGHSLFKNKRYLQAKHCFERALLPREMDVAEAYYLRAQARATPAGIRNGATRSAAFKVAADAFVGCGASAKSERRFYYHNAAECYARSGDDPKAAQFYEKAAELTLATQHYRKAGLFDDAVRIIETSPDSVDKSVADTILDVARLQWFREHNLEKAAKHFSSADEALEFTDNYDLDVARASLLAIMGRISEAAELHLAEGRALDAIQLLLEDPGHAQHMKQAKQYLLQGLWEILSFGMSPEVTASDQNFSQLLNFTNQLNRDVLAESDLDEVEMFHVIKLGNKSRLQELGTKFHHAHENDIAALLCLDHAFISPPAIQVATTAEVSRQLACFEVYVSLMKEFLLMSDPCNKPSIQRLFGFQPSTEHVFLLRPGSQLYQSSPQILNAGSSDKGIRVYERDLEGLIKAVLGERLRKRVSAENEMCQKAQSFAPCLPFAASGSCHRMGCPQEHVEAAALDLEWYNARVRIHLQQIRIYHALHSLRHIHLERQNVQRYWLDRLYDAMSPSFYKLGTVANLSSTLWQDRSFAVVKEWIRNLLFELREDHERQHFLTTLLKAAKLAFIIDSSEAPRYVCSAYVIRNSPHVAFIRPDGRRYVVSDLVTTMHGTEPHSISAGILSLRHIIETQLSININVLCDLIDHVCGSLVLSYRQGSNFHNTTLPRSWLLTLPDSIRNNLRKFTGLYRLLYEALAELVNQIYQSSSSAKYLLYGRIDIVRVSDGTVTRSVFIARICRAMCLLGYHIKDENLRNNIVKVMKSLSCDRRAIHAPYTWIKTWADLAKVVRQSTMGSRMDEMIHINSYQSKSSVPNLKGTRPIIIKNAYDIDRQIDKVPSVHTSNLRVDAAVFTPTVIQPATLPSTVLPSETDTLSEQRPRDTQDEENEGEYEESDGEEIPVDPESEAEAYPNDSSLTQKHDEPPSEQQLAAAKVVLLAYRRYHFRRQGHSRTGFAAVRDQLFVDCWEVVQKLKWPCGYYRCLVLGPLPHALLCVQEIISIMHADKAKKKKRMGKVMHQELEDVMVQINEVTTHLKEARRLQQALEPKSPFHLDRNVGQLVANIRRLEVLFASVPHRIHGGKMQELQTDLAIAVKGIVAIKQPRKKQKPELNVEDV